MRRCEDSPSRLPSRRHTHARAFPDERTRVISNDPGRNSRPLRREVNLGLVSELCHTAAKTSVEQRDLPADPDAYRCCGKA